MAVEWVDTDKWNRMCSGSGSWRLMVAPSLAPMDDTLLVAVECYDTSTVELVQTLLFRLNLREGGMELCLDTSPLNAEDKTFYSYRAYDPRLTAINDGAVSAYVKLLIKETAMQFKEKLTGTRIEHKCLGS